MLALRIAAFAAGLLLTGWTLMSAVKTVILPRSVQSVLNRVVMRPLGQAMRAVARMGSSFSWRDRVMALFGPFAMLALVFVAPYAPWTSDRSTPEHRPPRVRRWGRTRLPADVGEPDPTVLP